MQISWMKNLNSLWADVFLVQQVLLKTFQSEIQVMSEVVVVFIALERFHYLFLQGSFDILRPNTVIFSFGFQWMNDKKFVKGL